MRRKTGGNADTIERNNKIISSYESGTTMVYLAKTYGVSKQRIDQIVKRAGVYRKSSQQVAVAKNMNLIRDMRARGAMLSEIATTIGVSVCHLMKHVDLSSMPKYGVTDGLRHCPMCNRNLPVTDFYRSNKNVFGAYCKECMDSRHSKYAKANREHINEYARQWRKNNRELYLARQREYMRRKREKEASL